MGQWIRVRFSNPATERRVTAPRGSGLSTTQSCAARQQVSAFPPVFQKVLLHVFKKLILQSLFSTILGLQQYVNHELPEFKLVLEKAEELEIKLPTSTGSWKKQESIYLVIDKGMLGM